jgi:ABC-2 type transport system ATP-binding protein
METPHDLKRDVAGDAVLLSLHDTEVMIRARSLLEGQPYVREVLDVALGIVHEPEVLFLDEPSTGLDPQNRANLWDHVRMLRERSQAMERSTMGCHWR